jgi:quercetin dioxygenase-like cupin family protein
MNLPAINFNLPDIQSLGQPGGSLMKRNTVLVLIAMLVLPVAVTLAQDPVKVDAKHYKVEFENEQVRVLRATYGPHEKSMMHEHPDLVAIFVTDGNLKFATADGKSETRQVKAGQTLWNPATKHLPENLSDKPFEVILVELKHK